MEYIWLSEVDSTHKELKRVLASRFQVGQANNINQIVATNNANVATASKSKCTTNAHKTIDITSMDSSQICIVAERQSAGIGSRGHSWENTEDALMFSFTFVNPPNDLPKQSVAIYLGFIFKEVLHSLGSSVWLKYPNDFYVEKNKIGGILVSIYKQHFLCGIGLNLKSVNFGSLDIFLDKCEVLEKYFKILQKPPTWKQIFRKYRLEFYLNFSFSFHFQGEQISLKEAILREDGALKVGDRIIYNLERCGV